MLATHNVKKQFWMSEPSFKYFFAMIDSSKRMKLIISFFRARPDRNLKSNLERKRVDIQIWFYLTVRIFEAGYTNDFFSKTHL